MFGLSQNLRISLLTQEPGDELYAYFGHTAIRVKDDSLFIDRVYNYGTFDFSTPNFYTRFVKGDLDYCLSIDDFEYFVYSSQLSQRRIYEQELYLSLEEKNNLVILLEQCYNSPARYYRYDFLMNNCATKIRDIIKDATNNRIKFIDAKNSGATFRQLLNPYMLKNYWINLGINLIMGMESDKIASPDEYMFLPFYIQDYFENSNYASKSQLLLDASPKEKSGFAFDYLSPWIIILIICLMSFWKKTQKIVLYITCSIFSLLGLLILFLGIYSLHPSLGANMNILWTIPALLIIIVRNEKIGRYIRYAYTVIILLLFINWFWLPQELSPTFIPWMICMLLILIVDLRIIEKIKLSFSKTK
ncbi:MAG: DUF4105 domain-containing protein [Bacteroidales bacterium]|nr:DUF4105 domain-containing protein [Bacteroidales bacterium]